MVGDNESFASRWSRRKRLVAEEEIRAKESEKVVDLKDKEELDPDLPEELTAEEKLAELNKLTDEDMPDVETLDEESDYSGFMSANVSESLRMMALNKLFHGKSYNIRDGLDEYDGDYTFFEKLDPNTITSDMHHMIEVEAKRALAKKEEEEQKAEEERLLADADEIDTFEEFDEFEDEVETEVETEVSDLGHDADIEKNKENTSDNSNNEEVA